MTTLQGKWGKDSGASAAPRHPPPPQPQSVFGKRPAHCIILPFMPREGEGEGRCGVAEAGACFFRQPCPPEPRARL